MIKVAFSNSFKRSFKKRIKGQKEELFLQKLELFIKDPYHSQLRTHYLVN